jgi:hypothetical protein
MSRAYKNRKKKESRAREYAQTSHSLALAKQMETKIKRNGRAMVKKRQREEKYLEKCSEWVKENKRFPSMDELLLMSTTRRRFFQILETRPEYHEKYGIKDITENLSV